MDGRESGVAFWVCAFLEPGDRDPALAQNRQSNVRLLWTRLFMGVGVRAQYLSEGRPRSSVSKIGREGVWIG